MEGRRLRLHVEDDRVAFATQPTKDAV